MTEGDVASFVAAMTTAGIDFWITGGWGIDALVGRATRVHDDLDVSVDSGSLERVLDLADDLGFEVVTDWLPVRVAVRDQAGREIDIHPIVFETDGSAWLPDLEGGRFTYPAEAFATGTIGGRDVPCISAELQLTFHRGYPLSAKDRADIKTLQAAGLIDGRVADDMCAE